MTSLTSDFVAIKESVAADARGRVVLGTDAAGTSYRIEKNSLGQILLTPVVTIPAHEAWLFRNQEALSQVREGLAASATGCVVSRGDFTQFANIEIEEA